MGIVRKIDNITNQITFLFFNEVIREEGKTESSLNSYSFEELLSNFPDEIYHDALIRMFKRGLVKSQEEEVRLYTAIDEDENILAEAGLIIEHLKLVFEPSDTQSLIFFENLGYRVGSLEELKNLENQYLQKEIKRPTHWGGYIVKPISVEFWQGRPNRLHDRIRYSLQANFEWKIERLAP